MTLKGLFNKMQEKGYHYFSGNTNSTDDSIYLYFSTGYNGRGNSIELAVNPLDSYDVTFYTDGERLELEDVGPLELIETINKIT